MRISRLIAVLLIVAAAVGPRVWVAREHWQRSLGLWRDNTYVRAGTVFAREGFFTGGYLFQPVERTGVEPGYYTRHPPSYPLAIGVSLSVFGENYWAARLPDLFASLVLVFLLWRIAARSERDLPDVPVFVALLTAFTPGLVFGTFAGDVVAVWLAAAQVLVIWAYLAYRDSWSPAAGPLFVLAGVVALWCDWLALIAVTVCCLHLLLDRDAPPAGRRVAVMTASGSAAAFLFLLLFYVSPAGGFSGAVLFLQSVFRHALPGNWSGGGSWWEPYVSLISNLRSMLMLPVLLAGLWEIVFQPEDPRPNGIRTGIRLLLITAAVQAALFAAGSVDAHPHLLIPLVAAVSFAAAVRLARYPQAVISWSVLAVLLAASVWGIHGRIMAERHFYGPVIRYYGEVRQAVLERARTAPNPVIATNLWIPDGYMRGEATFLRTGNPDLLTHLPLTGYLAVSAGADLTPAPYRPLSADAVLKTFGEMPMQSGERLRWVPLKSGTEHPQTTENASVTVSLGEGLTLSWKPPLPLTDVEIGIAERLYRAEDIFREAEDRIRLSEEDGETVIRYRLPGTGNLVPLLRHYPLLAGAWAESFVRVHLKPLNRSFACPLPQREPADCRPFGRQ